MPLNMTSYPHGNRQAPDSFTVLPCGVKTLNCKHHSLSPLAAVAPETQTSCLIYECEEFGLGNNYINESRRKVASPITHHGMR
jgi:hypothetical protein